MDTRITRIKKLIAMALTAALFMTVTMVLSIQTTLAAGNDDENDEDRPEIAVEVVEEIPAEDIEEQEVPLADNPMTAAAGSMRLTVVTWTLGAVVIAYAVFIISGMKRRKTRRQIMAGSGGDRSDDSGGR